MCSAHTNIKLSQNKYTITLFGNERVGKTSYLNKLCTGKYNNGYKSTIGVKEQMLTFPTNYGDITFECRDTAGNEALNCSEVGYYSGSQAAIFIVDMTRLIPHKRVITLFKKWRSINGKTPMILCGNKSDSDFKILDKKHVDIEMSVKDNVNLHQPFLEIARELTGKIDLLFI